MPGSQPRFLSHLLFLLVSNWCDNSGLPALGSWSASVQLAENLEAIVIESAWSIFTK